MTYGGVAVKNISAASEISLCCSRPSNDGGDGVIRGDEVVMSALLAKSFLHCTLADLEMVSSAFYVKAGLLCTTGPKSVDFFSCCVRLD